MWPACAQPVALGRCWVGHLVDVLVGVWSVVLRRGGGRRVMLPCRHLSPLAAGLFGVAPWPACAWPVALGGCRVGRLLDGLFSVGFALVRSGCVRLVVVGVLTPAGSCSACSGMGSLCCRLHHASLVLLVRRGLCPLTVFLFRCRMCYAVVSYLGSIAVVVLSQGSDGRVGFPSTCLARSLCLGLDGQVALPSACGAPPLGALICLALCCTGAEASAWPLTLVRGALLVLGPPLSSDVLCWCVARRVGWVSCAGAWPAAMIRRTVLKLGRLPWLGAPCSCAARRDACLVVAAVFASDVSRSACSRLGLLCCRPRYARLVLILCCRFCGLIVGLFVRLVCWAMVGGFVSVAVVVVALDYLNNSTTK